MFIFHYRGNIKGVISTRILNKLNNALPSCLSARETKQLTSLKNMYDRTHTRFSPNRRGSFEVATSAFTPSVHSSHEFLARIRRRTSKGTVNSAASKCQNMFQTQVVMGHPATLPSSGHPAKVRVHVQMGFQQRTFVYHSKGACADSAAPRIQLCLAPSLSTNTRTCWPDMRSPQHDRATRYGITSASKTSCLRPHLCSTQT